MNASTEDEEIERLRAYVEVREALGWRVVVCGLDVDRPTSAIPGGESE